jgi:hypothetical protein
VRQLEDAVVLADDVERAAGHLLLGRVDARDVDAGQVGHVDERPPHLAAAVHGEESLAERVAHERVDHEVVTHARAPAVHRALPQRTGENLSSAMSSRIRSAL